MRCETGLHRGARDHSSPSPGVPAQSSPDSQQNSRSAASGPGEAPGHDGQLEVAMSPVWGRPGRQERQERQAEVQS